MILKGGFTEEQVSEILECKKQDCIPHLKNIIFDLNSDDCEAILSQGLSHLQSGKSLDSFNPEIEDYYMGELTDLQTVGCQFLYLAESAMLADDVGLGKTVQVAGLINLLKLNGNPRRLLFLGEKAGVRELALKLIQFTGDFFYPMDGGATTDNVKKFLSLYDVGNVSLVAPHSILSNETFKKYALKNTFDVVVFDESSMLKRIRTNVYKNTRAIARSTKRFIELNATPVEVLGSDIYNQMNLLKPNWLYSKAEFDRKYARKTFFMGRINLIFNKDASDFLEEVSLRYLARTRSSLPNSSNKNNLGVTLEIPPSVEQKNLLKVSSFYAYIADFPSRLKADIPVNEQTCPKLGALMSILQAMGVDDGKKALVYCHYKEAQQGIAEYLINEGYSVEILSGDENSKPAVRDAILDNFKNGNTNVLITNVKRTLDIKGCDIGVIYSIDPNPQKMVQFVGRLTRSFSVEDKSIFLLALKGRELTNLNKDIAFRVKTSRNFLGEKHSILYTALDNRILYKDYKTFLEDLSILKSKLRSEDDKI